MNEVQIFPSKEFGNIRTMMIEGHEYFCGNDVAMALCYQTPKDAISRHCKGATFQRPLGEQQKMKYIPLGDVYRLIVKASSQSNNEEIKEKAGRFESLVFDEILPQIHKTGSYGTPQTLQQQIQTIAKGTDELYQRIDELDAKIENSLSDLPLLGVEETKISNAVKRKGVEVLGGKQSNAYKDRSIVNVVYRDIYGQIYREFDINTYKAIKRNQCDIALNIIESYKLPLALQKRIANANAQQSLDLEGGAQ